VTLNCGESYQPAGIFRGSREDGPPTLATALLSMTAQDLIATAAGSKIGKATSGDASSVRDERSKSGAEKW
jgi:hypothetical protein